MTEDAESTLEHLQNFGGDGSFPAWGEFDGDELVGVRIDLDPPMEDLEDDE